MIGLPVGVDAEISPTALAEFRVFVESTSVNRALVHGTGFLYEVTDWKHAA